MRMQTWRFWGILFEFFWPGTAPWSGLDPSQTLRSGPGMLLDQCSAQTVDSGPFFDSFLMFLARLENQVWAKLGPDPPTRPAGSGTSLWAPFWIFFRLVFRRISRKCQKYVDPADPTIFLAFPGNA